MQRLKEVFKLIKYKPITGDNMCKIRLFYYENGEWGFAEWIVPYDKDLQNKINHWRIGGRMVTTEHIDLV